MIIIYILFEENCFLGFMFVKRVKMLSRLDL